MYFKCNFTIVLVSVPGCSELVKFVDILPLTAVGLLRIKIIQKITIIFNST